MLINANSIKIPIADKSIQCCVTSPPYWGLRDYGNDDQLGLEQTPEDYVNNMVLVFREVKRVLKDNGTLWLNLGDSYASNATTGAMGGKHGEISTAYQGRAGGAGMGSLKSKDLVGIPWRVALALQSDGWYLRSDIIWHKPNPTPESVKDRPTRSHEYIFLLTKSERYYYDQKAISEPLSPSSYGRYDYSFGGKKGEYLSETNQGGMVGNRERPDTRNKRTVWTITTGSYNGSHYATFPTRLPEICILAGSAPDDYVLDPFVGSGTTLVVSRKHKRKPVGIDISYDYLITDAMARLELDKLNKWTNETKQELTLTDYSDLPMFD